MSNILHVGFKTEIEYPTGGFLLIADDVPDIPKARVFDPLKHSFNPLRDLDYRKAREVSEVLYTLYPQGENTLTVRNGKRALLKALAPVDWEDNWSKRPRKKTVAPRRLDKIEGDEEVANLIQDILASPLLRKALCSAGDFSFNPRFKIIARINRAELGTFDALALGLLLISHYKGQLIIPDFGFYGRDIHASLIQEDRLIASVNHLSELPDKLRQSVLSITDKTASAALYDDAETLAKYAHLEPRTNEYNDFVREAMG